MRSGLLHVALISLLVSEGVPVDALKASVLLPPPRRVSATTSTTKRTMPLSMSSTRQQRKTKEDLHEILGVSPDADRAEIKSVYKSLAKQYHPDANPDKDTTKHFQEINHAYQVLMEKHEEEQKLLLRQQEEKDVDSGDDLVCTLEIDYHMSVSGGQKMVRLCYLEPCFFCGGDGYYCAGCGGRGGMPNERTLMIYIPRGVEHGDMIRIEHQGIPGLRGVGDLYLHLSVKDEWRTNDSYGRVTYVDAQIDNQVASHWTEI